MNNSIGIGISLAITLAAGTASLHVQAQSGTSVKVKGGNGCTIVRKVTVFSPKAPGPETTEPDGPWATLEQQGSSGWTPLASTAIDPKGTFSFDNVGPGTYRVCGEAAVGACYAEVPLPGKVGGSASATCPAPTGSRGPATVLTVKIGPGTVTGDCPTCGKSATSSKNNAR
jgi:hypothetical protein